MATNPAVPSDSSWKQDTRSAHPRRRGPRWRRAPADAGRQRAIPWRQLKLALALAAFGGCAGLLVWVSTWLRPVPPVGLVLVGADYADNLALPHNVFGWHAVVDLAQVAREPSGVSFWRAGSIRLQQEPRELR